jgi:hypothetical protein
MFSSSILGVYSVGYQLASIFAILLMAINKAAVPYYYDHIKNGKVTKFVAKKYALLSLVIVPVPMIIFWLIPQDIYVWVLGVDFEHAKYYTIIFVLGLALTIPYLILVNFYFYHGQKCNDCILHYIISSSLRNLCFYLCRY